MFVLINHFRNMFKKGVIILFPIMLLFACSKNKKQVPIQLESKPLFAILEREHTGVDFVNEMKENAILNGLMFEFIYNGGGVATADFNNDNLVDLYFISNLKHNQIYLNKGNLEFENTTETSRLEGGFGFSTGITTVDINYDGLLDIYVSKSGSFGDKEVLKNELYVNIGMNAQGIPVFEEKAAEYNLDITDYSTQAAFFDYDRDGDLDMFLINYGIKIYPYNKVQELMKLESENIGERLYRNDNQKYYDVSKEAGIINNQIGFGLGLALGDLNNDQWPDVVVANDFSEKDHIYINQKNGTFKEVCRESTKHISSSSMGNEIADINNDGWLDFITLDMMSDNNYDIKTSMGNMEPSLFNNLLESGLHYQYMYNSLQLNNGTPAGSDTPIFSDIAQLSGISSTDWSWAPLFFDMDNNGHQDLFVSNGIKRDFRNNDFVMSYREIQKHMAKAAKQEDRKKISWLIMEALSIMPTRERVNYFLLNDGDLKFERKNLDWKINNASVTNGAAYADLDNDGDMDIVGNNMDGLAVVYENHSEKISSGHFLQINLKGSVKNPDGIGARITLKNESGDIQVREQYRTRGYQSAISDVLHFGLGEKNIVEELQIVWPDGKVHILKGINADMRITLDYKDASFPPPKKDEHKDFLFEQASLALDSDYKHIENEFDDFGREYLLPHKMSQFGPGLAVGDINQDGLDDFFVGGAHNQSGKLFVQKENGDFQRIAANTFNQDKSHEDVNALFFDADNDGDLDLYVVSGGNEFSPDDPYYKDRLYENLGKNQFEKMDAALPVLLNSGSKAVPCDFDHDGDMDLFIGGRLSPGKYPFAGSSTLLKNESKPGAIKFVDATEDLCPEIRNVGMVSDAIWIDANGDGFEDLILAGEWMPIKVFENHQGQKFNDISTDSGMDSEVGWWNCLAPGDFDSDGDVDFIAGNLGLNHKFKASQSEPFEVYAKDFDNNGKLDIILGFHEEELVYPIRDKDYLTKQMRFIRTKFPLYHDFAMASVSEIFGQDNIDQALNFKATNFASCYVENLGNGTFNVKPLPVQAQFSSVNSIIVNDFDVDGYLDILIAGNFYQSEMETPRNDASIGLLLKGDGHGNFDAQSPLVSGLYIDGEVRNGSMIKIGVDSNKNHAFFAKNNDFLQLIKVSKSQN